MLLALALLVLVGLVLASLATLTRSMFWTFAGVIAFFVVYFVSASFLSDLENQFAAALIDPVFLATPGSFWSLLKEGGGVWGNPSESTAEKGEEFRVVLFQPANHRDSIGGRQLRERSLAIHRGEEPGKGRIAKLLAHKSYSQVDGTPRLGSLMYYQMTRLRHYFPFRSFWQ